ncbi:hypothetical protein Thermo_01674 [Thermoplasmatales archaeon]|nr:hypothetical protein Thermo_01674 [Thermoplasmatales archaeon]
MSQILHVAGEMIGLALNPGLQKVVKHPVKDENGTQLTEVKNGKTVKVYHEKYIYPKTNGVCVRSFRKTWESWVMMTEGYDPIKMGMVAQSQGHELITAGEHYLNFGFTESDKEEIKPYTKGYGHVEFVFKL